MTSASLRRRLAVIIGSAFCLVLPFAAVPAAAQAAFGLSALDVSITDSGGAPETQAGSHPFAYTTALGFNTVPSGIPEPTVYPDEDVRDVVAVLPPGLIGNPSAVPTCSAAEFTDIPVADPQCAPDTVVGQARLSIGAPDANNTTSVFNLEPTPGAVAKLGLTFATVPVTLDAYVTPEPPYRVVVVASNTSNLTALYATELTIWGVPADHGTGAPDKPYLTLPRSCPGTPLSFDFALASWTDPGSYLADGSPDLSDPDWVTATDTTPAITGCGLLGFDPAVSAAPTTTDAASPAGFDFNVSVDDPGLTDPDGLAESDLKQAIVTLPEGLTVNPSSAGGLGACSPAQVAQETATSGFGDGCPAASRVADVTIETPLLPGEPVSGSVFLATPDDPSTPAPGAENPFDELLAGYLVAKNADRGVSLVLPGQIEADPTTGQLTTIFDENPQFPFSDLDVSFKSGNRGVLATPPTCGIYEVTTELFPWSGNPSITETDEFVVDAAPGGGPCVAGDPSLPADPADRADLPFSPDLTAGTVTPTAGSSSPFVLRLQRDDGEQELKRISADLPPGLTARLAGVARCSDATLAAIPAAIGTGAEELASPSCPANSQIGRANIGAGVGPTPFYLTTSKAYLAGPFDPDGAGPRGTAPLSMAIVSPAVTGPFDLGNVVVRTALYVDQDDAQVHAVSEQLPHILHGLALHIRDIRVVLDRAGFTLNPTNCDPMAVTATLSGAGEDPGDPSDDSSAPVTDHFQVSDCGALSLGPRMTTTLLNGKSGTGRSAHPNLLFNLNYRAGDANLRRVELILPRAFQIDQSNLGNICSETLLIQNECAGKQRVGTATATTPLLDQPLNGLVYAVSGSGGLPKLAIILHGPPELPVKLVVRGTTDTVGARIRNTIPVIPDAPVTSFALNIDGGPAGYLVNNQNLCTKVKGKGKRKRIVRAPASRSDITYFGHNGDSYREQSAVTGGCPKKKRKKGKKRKKPKKRKAASGERGRG